MLSLRIGQVSDLVLGLGMVLATWCIPYLSSVTTPSLDFTTTLASLKPQDEAAHAVLAARSSAVMDCSIRMVMVVIVWFGGWGDGTKLEF
jgi:hypothetical protein